MPEWLPFSSPGDLMDPGTEHSSLASLACRQILYHWVTWEAKSNYMPINKRKKKNNLNFFVCVMTFPLAFPDDSWINKLVLGRNHIDVALDPSLESSSSVAWRQFLDLSEPHCLWIKKGQYFRVPMAMVAPIYLRIIVTIIIFTCRS